MNVDVTSKRKSKDSGTGEMPLGQTLIVKSHYQDQLAMNAEVSEIPEAPSNTADSTGSAGSIIEASPTGVGRIVSKKRMHQAQ